MNQWNKFYAGRRCSDYDYNKVVTRFIPSDVVSNNDPAQAVLKAIYSRDPITDAPNGDIACYVSSETSPEVKKWILDNLMCDMTKQALPSAPKGVSDEVITSLMRNANESQSSYVSRVNDYMQRNVEFAKHLKDAQKSSVSNTSSTLDDK